MDWAAFSEMLGLGFRLAWKESAPPAPVLGCQVDQNEQGQGFKAKQLGAEQHSGDRGVACGGEHRHKAECCEGCRIQAERVRDRVSKSRAHKKKGCDLSSLESAADANGRQDELPEPTPQMGTILGEGGTQGYRSGTSAPHAEAQIIGSGIRLGESCQRCSDQQGGQPPAPRFLKESARGVGCAKVEQGGRSAAQAGAQEGCKREWLRQFRPVRVEGWMGGVMAATEACGGVASESGEQAQRQQAQAPALRVGRFEREYGGGKRGAKNRTESSGDRGLEQGALVGLREAEDPLEQRREACGELDGSALAADGGAAQVSGRAEHKDERSDAGRDLPGIAVDAFDDEVVAPRAFVVFEAIEGDREDSNQRRAKNQGGMVESQGGRQLQAACEGCATGAGHSAEQEGEGSAAQGEAMR
jgi:hypothetical protein